MPTARTVKGNIISYAAAQELGQRSKQEDRFMVEEMTTADGRPAVLALVADGIGGHNLGEVASDLAARQVPLHFAAKEPVVQKVGQALREAVEETSHDIYSASLADAAYEGMGTTCTAFVLVDGCLYLCHAGDSRLYLLHGSECHQVTIDHTWAEDAIRAGFSVDEIREHPNRGVLRRFLGINPTVEVDTRYRWADSGDPSGDSLVDPISVEPGDELLLCTDGLADELSTSEINQILRSGNPGYAAARLVQRAVEAGATDNITAVVLRVAGDARAEHPLRGWLIAASVLGLAMLVLALLLVLRLAG